MAFDAFISYSHAADGLLAPRVQEGLQRFAKPWWRRRALHVFRDETGLSANPGLWTSIVAALDDSRYFVLLASPEAARSEWVNREVEYWAKHKDPNHILAVCTDGTWEWDAGRLGFAAAASAVPPALAGVFDEEPRHIDMRWARDDAQLDLRNGRFRDQIAELAAPMHGVAKDDIAGMDVVQHRRTVRTAWAAAIALVLLTLLSGSAAFAAAHNAATARAARRNADANAASARSSADEANHQKAAADAAAAAENRQRQAADASAAQATRAQSDAEASAAEANQQRAAAVQSAEAERVAQTEAQRNAAEALMQQHKAEALNQELGLTNDRLASTNGQLASTNDQLASTNGQLASTNDQLALTNDQLASANDQLAQSNDQLQQQEAALAAANKELLDANGDLDAGRLVALAESERAKGNLDTAMLLANEAVSAARTDPTPARNEALTLALSGPYLERYLPGPGFSPGPTFRGVVTRADRVVQFDIREGIDVWRLDALADPPTTMDTSGFEVIDRPRLTADGSRIIDVVVDRASQTGDVAIWNTDTGALAGLFPSDGDSYLMSADGRSAAIPNSTGDVTLVDVPTATVVARWTGRLVREIEPTGCATEVASGDQRDGCEFSPDGRYLIGWSDQDATFVVWDRQHPQQTTTLYTPVGFSSYNPPPQFIGSADDLIGAPDNHTIAIYTPGGDVVSSVTIDPGSILDFLAAPVGDFAVVYDDTETVTRIDVGGGASVRATRLTQLDLPACGLPFMEFSPHAEWLGLHESSALCAAPNRVYVATDPGAGSTPRVRAGDGGGAVDAAFGRDNDGSERYVITFSGIVDDLVTGRETTLPLPPFGSCVTSPHDLKVACGSAVLSLDDFDAGASIDVGSAFPVAEFDDHADRAIGLSGSERVSLLDLDRAGAGTAIASTTIQGDPSGDYEPGVVFSPNGSLMAEGGTTEAVGNSIVTHGTIHDLDTGATMPIDAPDFGSFDRAWFTGDSRDIVFQGSPSDLVDAATGAVLGHADLIEASSGDGRRLLVLDGGRQLLVSPTDLHHGQTMTLALESPFGTTALNQDGSRLAYIEAGSGALVVIDTATNATVAREDSFGALFRLSFSPDGSKVAASDSFNDVAVVDARSGAVLARADGAAGFNCGAGVAWTSVTPTWSPDGQLLDFAGQLLDPRNLLPIGGPLPCTTFGAAAFTTGSLRYALVDWRDQTKLAKLDVLEVPTDVGALRAGNCSLAGRNFTQAEWGIFEPNVAYRRTCDAWPAG